MSNHCHKHGWFKPYDGCLYCRDERLITENAALKDRLAKAENLITSSEIFMENLISALERWKLDNDDIQLESLVYGIEGLSLPLKHLKAFLSHALSDYVAVRREDLDWAEATVRATATELDSPSAFELADRLKAVLDKGKEGT